MRRRYDPTEYSDRLTESSDHAADQGNSSLASALADEYMIKPGPTYVVSITLTVSEYRQHAIEPPGENQAGKG
ncbi:hypothetical protein KEM60_02075 [Austwickia sp. TVS 96-490-7B]|nr:hypothetical protein [Austwickia sp. TVS 96-490-7B]